MHRIRRVAMDEEQLDKRHQLLFSERRLSVLVANGKQVAAASILKARENDVGDLLLIGLVKHGQLQQLRASRVRTQLDANL
jgi:hypothetical protein